MKCKFAGPHNVCTTHHSDAKPGVIPNKCKSVRLILEGLSELLLLQCAIEISNAFSLRTVDCWMD